jgi:hypothetical protein
VPGLSAFLAAPEADFVTGTSYTSDTIDGGLKWNYREQ